MKLLLLISADMINRNKIAEKKYSFKSFILVGLLDIYKVSEFLALLKYDFKNTNKFENLIVLSFLIHKGSKA